MNLTKEIWGKQNLCTEEPVQSRGCGGVDGGAEEEERMTLLTQGHTFLNSGRKTSKTQDRKWRNKSLRRYRLFFFFFLIHCWANGKVNLYKLS